MAIPKGTSFDFTDLSTLTAADVTMPEDYKYVASHCGSDWAANNNWFHDSYTVSQSTTVWPETVLDVCMAPSTIRDSIKVEIQKDGLGTLATVETSGTQFTYNGATCTFSTDGKLTITLQQLKTMFGGGNSFTIYIRNGANTIEIGNVAEAASSITVEYFYQEPTMVQYASGYGLVNPNMELVIKMWW